MIIFVEVYMVSVSEGNVTNQMTVTEGWSSSLQEWSLQCPSEVARQ